MAVLVAAGADLNVRCRMDGSTPLLIAVYHRQDAIAHVLIAAGADLNLPDNEEGNKRTPLWYAFQKEHVRQGGGALVEALMEAGAELEAEQSQEEE